MLDSEAQGTEFALMEHAATVKRGEPDLQCHRLEQQLNRPTQEEVKKHQPNVKQRQQWRA